MTLPLWLRVFKRSRRQKRTNPNPKKNLRKSGVRGAGAMAKARRVMALAAPRAGRTIRAIIAVIAIAGAPSNSGLLRMLRAIR